ncbi:HIT family protein [Rhodococcus spelaei]|uniref:HIT family protein n=1 Tax=Rhodococcus spelaei TaxID=2546320 RepID=A0A541BPM6_9NOCA|nr:HIT family protein [Rhodococcus spelaei]TQF74294.1 HIT family protein [Rhodococcus spelaei]
MNCVFCAIVARTAEASIVHEDEHTLAFMDIRPFTPGHLLVVPKRHASGLAQLDPEDGRRVFAVGQRLAAALRDNGTDLTGLPTDGPCADGVNLFLADGAVAGQEVFHVHLHVIPRTAGDGFGLRGRPTMPRRPDLDYLAGAIRRRLG